MSPPGVQPPAAAQANNAGLLGDIFGGGAGVPGLGAPTAGTGYVPPQQVWLAAARGKGMEISGTFSRRGGHIHMDMTFTNRAMQPLNQFAIQLNKNSFGLAPAAALQVPSPLMPNQSAQTSLQLLTGQAVQKMEPLLNLQVAVKNDVDVFYFACIVPMLAFYADDGLLDKRLFLQAWQDIPEQNEVQYNIANTRGLSADDVCTKLQANNVFTVARRTLEGQEMLYHSVKFTNGIVLLSELKIQPDSSQLTLSMKSRNVAVIEDSYKAFELILQS